MNKRFARRMTPLLGLATAMSLLIAGCSTATTTGGQSSATTDTSGVYGTFIIGRTPDTAGELVAQIYGQALRADGNDVALTIPSTVPVFVSALQQRAISMVATPLTSMGDALFSLTSGSNPSDPRTTTKEDSLDEARTLAEPLGFSLLLPTTGTQEPVYAVSKEFSESTRVTTLSQLAAWSDGHQLRFAGPPACYVNSACLPRLEAVYGLSMQSYVEIDGNGEATAFVLQHHQADVGYLSSTDIDVTNPDLVMLTQDIPMGVFGNITPAVIAPRASAAATGRINSLSALMTTEALTTMVRSVEAGEATAAQVASYFLDAHGINASANTEELPTVGVTMRTVAPSDSSTPKPAAQVIGIAHGGTTQMEIVANLYQGALDIAGIQTKMIDEPILAIDVPEAFLHNEIQLTPTLLGFAAQTVNTQTHGPLALPITGTPEEMMTEANSAAAHWGYQFLAPSSAQDENTFAVGKDFAKSTGISTLSGLAAYSYTHPINVAGPPGCSADPECGNFLRDKYGVRIGKMLTTDWSGPLTREAIDTGAADTGLMLGLDPGVPYFGFTKLKDDRAAAAPANVTPALTLSAATPKVIDVLNRLSARLDPEEIAELTKLYELMDYSMDYVVTHALEEYGFLQTHTTVELSPDKD